MSAAVYSPRLKLELSGAENIKSNHQIMQGQDGKPHLKVAHTITSPMGRSTYLCVQ